MFKKYQKNKKRTLKQNWD